MSLRHLHITVITMAALLLCGACRHVNDMEYARFERLPADGWDPVDVREFNPMPADTVGLAAKRYDLAVMLRYGRRPVAEELRLLATTVLSDSVLRCDTVTFRLVDAEGTPLGKGAGFAYELADTIVRDISLSPDLRVELTPLTAPEAWRNELAVAVTATARN